MRVRKSSPCCSIMRPMRRHSMMSVPIPAISMMHPPLAARLPQKSFMPTVDLLADLTPAQREAVTHLEGPLLILAGAGSGKTRVITRRVAYLLHQGVRPYHILAITFTNKAAGEMRQRVEQLVPGCRVWISTFHSLGARLLRQYGDRFD